jgi:S1-C subfamily serine protease
VLFKQSSRAVVQVVIRDRNGKTMGSGSGFLVSQRGLIATNHHVIAKAHSAYVIFGDNTKASVLGAAAVDADSDLAILKVAGQTSMQPLEFAGNELPPVGVKVYAIGNPLGLANVLSDGLVSGHQPKNPRLTVILTTAPISPGSSGGPLLTADGKVVGVTTGMFKGGQNLNIAVPISRVAKLLSRSMDGGQPMQFPLTAQATEIQTAPSAPVLLSFDERSKCTLKLGASSNQLVVFNGTENWTITKVVVGIRTARWTRNYAVSVMVEPLAEQSYPLDFDEPDLAILAVNAKSMTGVSARR